MPSAQRKEFDVIRPLPITREPAACANRCVKLFVAQGGNGIDARGFPRGHVAGGDCDAQQQRGDRAESERIAGLHAWDNVDQQLVYADGAKQTDGCADSGEAESLTKPRPSTEDLPAPSAMRIPIS